MTFCNSKETKCNIRHCKPNNNKNNNKSKKTQKYLTLYSYVLITTIQANFELSNFKS